MRLYKLICNGMKTYNSNCQFLLIPLILALFCEVVIVLTIDKICNKYHDDWKQKKKYLLHSFDRSVASVGHKW